MCFTEAETQSRNTHLSIVARRNAPLSGTNLEQDYATKRTYPAEKDKGAKEERVWTERMKRESAVMGAKSVFAQDQKYMAIQKLLMKRVILSRLYFPKGPKKLHDHHKKQIL